MPSVAAIGTHLPAIAPAVAAGRAVLAGVTPSDVGVAEVPDFFPGIELIGYEELGFADRFGVDGSVEAGATTVGGQLPVNPSGGLEAEGHPPGAAGVTQRVEPSAVLRGDAVEGTRIGLAHNHGRPTSVSAVTILEGPGSGG
jgi:acetyl-CoA C-acetyltransferase